MPRKKAAKAVETYTSLFFKVDAMEHYVGFSIAHDAAQTGIYHSKLFSLELSGKVGDDCYSHPGKQIYLTVYARHDLILNEVERDKEVKARLDWRIEGFDAQQKHRQEITQRLTPDTIGIMELRKGELWGTVWIEPEAWHLAHDLALSGKPVYADLTGAKVAPCRFIGLRHFALTTKTEV